MATFDVPHAPGILSVGSPVTGADLARLGPATEVLQFSALPGDDELPAIGAAMAYHPDCTLRAYANVDKSIVDLEWLRHFPGVRRLAVEIDELESFDGLRHLPDDLERLQL